MALYLHRGLLAVAALFALGLSPAIATPIGTGQIVNITDPSLVGQNVDFNSSLTYVSTGTNSPYDVGAGLVDFAPNTYDNTTFTDGLGSSANQVQWTGSGGFITSTGIEATVNIGGLATPETLTWGLGGFVPTGSTFVLSDIQFQNGINLGTDSSATRQIDIGLDAAFSGSITGSGNLLLQAYGQVGLHPFQFITANAGVTPTINISGALTANNVDMVLGGVVTASGLNLNESTFQMVFQGTPSVSMSGGSRWDLFAEDGTNNLNQTLTSLNSTDSGSFIDMAGYAGFLQSPGPSSVHLTVDSGYYAGRLLENNNQATLPVGITPGFGASLIKDGPGILTLANDNGTTANINGAVYYGYSQGTTVKQGTLLVTNTTGSATGTGAVTVMSGGSLGGSGIIAPTGTTTISVADGNGPATPHDLVVESGGAIDMSALDPAHMPASLTNTLTIALHASDAATFESGASFIFDLGPAGSSSELAFKGLTNGLPQVFFNDNAVDLNLLPGAADGTYTLFTFDQSNAYSGILQNGADYTFNYNPTSISVTVTPEPSAMSLILSGLLVIVLVRQRSVRLTGQCKNGTKND